MTRLVEETATFILGMCLSFTYAGMVDGAASAPRHSIAVFSVDVTPPVGHPLLAGQVPDAAGVADKLEARGLTLIGSNRPIVFVAVDWCEIRNEAYRSWQTVLAEAAGTEPNRVLVASVHQHDAPLADLQAERILRRRNLKGRVVDPEFHEQTVRKAAAALRAGLAGARPISHLGIGAAAVDRIASNRRYLDDHGRPRHDRMSATRDPLIRDRPEGVIDPRLRTISFWDGDQCIAALSSYSVHPMSYYGTAQVSADFPGIARRIRQAQTPGVFQIYASGCSGNTVAGKYNDGNPKLRAELAGRLVDAMIRAAADTQRFPLEGIEYRSAPLRFKPRMEGNYAPDAVESRLRPDADPKSQSLAALTWSWHRRVETGIPVELPLVDFGRAQLLLFPGESYVEYQLAAQQLRPQSFVMSIGYGECAPGYVPTEKAWEEHDANLGSWCWIAPGAEVEILRALEKLLLPRAD